MSIEAKVGSFVLAGLIFLSVAIFLLGDFTMEKQYQMYVTFHDVAGLTKSSPVKLSGVDIGKVKKMDLDENLAKVTIRIKDGVEVYKDATFSIGTTGIIGTKFLQIEQGHRDSGVLGAETVIRGDDPKSIEKELVKALGSIEKLMEGFNGEGTPKPGTLAHNLNATVANMRDLTANLNDLIETSRPHLEEAMSRADSISEKLDQLLAKSNQMMAGLATDKGAVGALIHDDKVKQDVKQTISDFKDVAGTAKDVFSRINQFRVFWNYDWRYEHLIRTSRADVGIKIVPRPGHYYYFGGSNLMNLVDTRKSQVDYAQANRVDALMGWIWGPVDFAIGGIRSGGGARVTVTPFYKDPMGGRFSLMAQAYDFGRNRIVQSKQFNKPAYDLAVMGRINSYVGLGARVEELATTKRYQSWINVTWEDKDLAYLFGLATFGAASAKGRSKNH